MAKSSSSSSSWEAFGARLTWFVMLMLGERLAAVRVLCGCLVDDAGRWRSTAPSSDHHVGGGKKCDRCFCVSTVVILTH